MQLGPRAAEGGEVLPHVLLNGHDLLHLLDIVLPGGGQGDGVGAPVEEGSLDLLLHLLHHRTEPGLGDEKFLGGLGEAVLLVDGVDVLLVVQHESAPYKQNDMSS